MRLTLLRFGFLAILILCLGCGSDDEEPIGAGGMAGSSNSGGTGGGSSLCQQGCVETLAANCASGPATQAQCESDCEMLRTGPCASQYQAFQACAEGEPITCGPQGIPVVEACASEQTAFVGCLN